jgi:hypothetical protein
MIIAALMFGLVLGTYSIWRSYQACIGCCVLLLFWRLYS